jgi:vacuolar-type H+-ATPase subunit H
LDILLLIDRLEEVITSAKRVPFGSRVMVDEQECLGVIDQIKLAVPDELQVARRVMAERDRILHDAEERANRLVARAEEQAADRVEDHAVVLAAEDRAREMVAEAQREAEEVRRQVDDYAGRVLLSLQNRLRRLEQAVQNGLDELRGEYE